VYFIIIITNFLYLRFTIYLLNITNFISHILTYYYNKCFYFKYLSVININKDTMCFIMCYNKFYYSLYDSTKIGHSTIN